MHVLQQVRELAGRVPHAAAVAGFLTVYVFLALVAAFGDAATYDEGGHLSCGYAYIDRGHMFSPEHPPLGKLWAALWLRLRGPGPVDYDCDEWRQAKPFHFGYHFLYGPPGAERRRPPLERLLPGRLAIVALGLALGLIAYAWSRELWRRRGAVMTVGLYALSPLVLAHTHVVTTDAAATFGFVLTLWMFWRWCRAPSAVRAALVGLALGVALLTKMSAVILGPMLFALTMLWLARRARWLGWKSRVPPAVAHLLLIGAVAYGVLWAGYAFRFRSSPDPAHAHSVQTVSFQRLWLQRVLCFADRYRLLPESYLYGFATYDRAGEHFMYFNGQVTWEKSWSMWYFFPEVVVLKSTPAELAVMAWLTVVSVRRRRSRSFSWGYMAASVAMYFGIAVFSRVTIGQRHLLPMYVMLFVFAGALVRLYARERRGWLALAAIVVLHAVSSFSVCPRYLAYFNVIGGGPDRASRYLLDSNLDWGQDLSRLPAAMERMGIAEVYLVYNGTADPRAYGIRYRKAAEWSKKLGTREPVETPPAGAYVAISLLELRCSKDALPRRLSTMTPVGRAGDSIFIYRMP